MHRGGALGFYFFVGRLEYRSAESMERVEKRSIGRADCSECRTSSTLRVVRRSVVQSVLTLFAPNKALEPTAVGAFTLISTRNITSPASVTRHSAAVAQLGR